MLLSLEKEMFEWRASDSLTRYTTENNLYFLNKVLRVEDPKYGIQISVFQSAQYTTVRCNIFLFKQAHG